MDLCDLSKIVEIGAWISVRKLWQVWQGWKRNEKFPDKSIPQCFMSNVSTSESLNLEWCCANVIRLLNCTMTHIKVALHHHSPMDGCSSSSGNSGII